MLMLKPKLEDGEKVDLLKNPYVKRTPAGIGFALRWQKVYRGLELCHIGAHKPDEGTLLSDVGVGISFNISGLHLFIGLLYESHYVKMSQSGK